MDLDLHHLYRAMAWLGEELPEEEQAGHTFSPRCTKDLIEEELFFRTRDLFSSLDLVFFDTTSIYFEGEGGQTLGKRGHNKDHRPDLKQMVVGAVIDGDGRPICCELWPGNTADVTTLAAGGQAAEFQVFGGSCVPGGRQRDDQQGHRRRPWKPTTGRTSWEPGCATRRKSRKMCSPEPVVIKW